MRAHPLCGQMFKRHPGPEALQRLAFARVINMTAAIADPSRQQAAGLAGSPSRLTTGPVSPPCTTAGGRGAAECQFREIAPGHRPIPVHTRIAAF